MPRQLLPRPAAVTRRGRTYNGAFRQEGEIVYIYSIYGSTIAGVVIGDADPKIVAEGALAVILAQRHGSRPVA